MPEAGEVVRVRARGPEVLREPLLFRGTAFTEQERTSVGAGLPGRRSRAADGCR